MQRTAPKPDTDDTYTVLPDGLLISQNRIATNKSKLKTQDSPTHIEIESATETKPETRPQPLTLNIDSDPITQPQESKLDYSNKESVLNWLAQHDSVLFEEYSQSYQFLTQSMLQLVTDFQNKKPLALSEKFLETYHTLLSNDSDINDLKLFAALITPPTEEELYKHMELIDQTAIRTVHEFVERTLAKEFKWDWRNIVKTSGGDDEGERYLSQIASHYLELSNQSSDTREVQKQSAATQTCNIKTKSKSSTFLRPVLYGLSATLAIMGIYKAGQASNQPAEFKLPVSRR